MSLTEQEYNKISGLVYRVDKKHENYKSYLKEGNSIKTGDFYYKILKIEDNTSNGMQAMAVAPVGEDGKADTSEVVIAYAGTNPSDGADIETDIQTINWQLKKNVVIELC